MNWFSSIEKITRRDVPLADLTTFRIGGRAAFLIEPTDAESFAKAYRCALDSGLPVHILGMGSNLLVSDEGVPGVVLTTRHLDDGPPERDGDRVRVSAGTALQSMVRWSARAGMKGLECLAGIPGTVGGAVVMNAGARGGCIGDRVQAVWCVGRDGTLFRRAASEVAWGYRETDIEDPVARLELKLESCDPDSVLDSMADALIEKRRSQPATLHSAGCFFKNPQGDSAGRLIDAAGLKGYCVGDAIVSDKHANFIVNRGRASASEVLGLFRTVRNRVRDRFGINLENEVRFWPGPTGMA